VSLRYQIESQPWYGLYLAAVSAPEQQLVEHINAAEVAINRRLRDLQDDGDHSEERQSLKGALDALEFLRRSAQRS
jgi:hypothetical protein